MVIINTDTIYTRAFQESRYHLMPKKHTEDMTEESSMQTKTTILHLCSMFLPGQVNAVQSQHSDSPLSHITYLTLHQACGCDWTKRVSTLDKFVWDAWRWLKCSNSGLIVRYLHSPILAFALSDTLRWTQLTTMAPQKSHKGKKLSKNYRLREARWYALTFVTPGVLLLLASISISINQN